MRLLPQKRVLVPKISFSFFCFFFVGKNLLLRMVVLEKVANRGFLALRPFKDNKKHKIAAKSEYYPPRHHWTEPFYSSCTVRHSISNTSTTGTSPTKPLNIRTYQYHTSYYADHRFSIINTNRFVIKRCEFYLCLN